MAQLYFKYGAMGSSKTANALMARFNYEERGQETLMVKPRLDTRDGDHMVSSRIGLTHPCIYFDEMRAMADQDLQKYACIIIDEAQFLTKDEVFYLVHLVDDCGIPVLCYGLKVDFRGQLFEGSYYLLAMADPYVDASLAHFDIAPHLSMDVGPAVMQDGRTRYPSLGLAWALNF